MNISLCKPPMTDILVVPEERTHSNEQHQEVFPAVKELATDAYRELPHSAGRFERGIAMYDKLVRDEHNNDGVCVAVWKGIAITVGWSIRGVLVGRRWSDLSNRIIILWVVGAAPAAY